MHIDVSQAPFLDVYQTLVSVVTPRPIAWVTTIDRDGRVNLAPFSFFNAFGANPPVVVFSPTLRRDATKKDTLLNVEATGEFVVHAAVASLAEKVNATSRELPYGESEVEYVGLHTVPSLKVKPPRLVESPVAMECKNGGCKTVVARASRLRVHRTCRLVSPVELESEAAAGRP